MKCFVIMPFQSSFDAVFATVKDAASHTISEAGFECYWLKDVHAAGRITDDIIKGLSDAAFCVSDVSGHNPNVMWETGYAMALGKPTILIGQDIASLPFDLASHRVLAYSMEALDELKPRLIKSIRDTLAKYELRGTGSVALPATTRANRKTIAVTGSMDANEAAVTRRVQSMLTPYLSDSTSWLTGSMGTVDLVAVRFLLEHNQDVTAIGYHRFDCAPELREEIDKGRMKFVDASVEVVPRGVKGPTERDVIFCVKSDLAILFWDGKSEGTGELVQYFQSQGASTMVAFV